MTEISSPLKSFLSGGFGGMALVLVGHPLDLVKVQLQTTTKYSGTINAITQIFKANGIRGLYRGMSGPLIGITPIFAVCFWGYDLGQNIARKISGNKSGALTFAETCFAGGFSAIPATALMAPLERIKVVMQTQKERSGILSVVAQVYNQGGVRGIFRGTLATLLRDIPGSVAYFGSYEVLKQMLTPAGKSSKDLNPGAVLFAGGMAGISNWLVAIPADVIKSRLQSAPEGMYAGAFHVLKQLLKNEGPAALYKGLQPAMIRAFPANAACFFGVELSLKIMNSLF